MRRVILESPYGSNDPEIRHRNRRYARAVMRHLLLRGDAPIASHLLYTQPGVLDDDDAYERALGIAGGLLWGQSAELTVIALDLGETRGMTLGRNAAIEAMREIEEIRLGDGWDSPELADDRWVDR